MEVHLIHIPFVFHFVAKHLKDSLYTEMESRLEWSKQHNK